MKIGAYALGVALTSFASFASAEKISIAVGHQSMCTDTYTAGIIVKELGLLEKYLPTDGKYADAEYDVSWADDSLRTLYVAGTGYNMKGSGNAIVVPVDSDVYSIDQLKGMEVSTPVGSAAWGMLLKAMQDNNIPTGEYVLKNQSPAVGAANIAAGNRKIYDGSETGVPYLHGVVVREDFAVEYPEVVQAFIKAVYAAGEWVREDPMRAVHLSLPSRQTGLML